MKTYVNGVASGTPVSFFFPIFNSAQAFRIGATSTTTMLGNMQDVGIWSRALSAAEVLALYNSGAGSLYSNLSAALKTGLVSYYDLTYQDYTDKHGSNNMSRSATTNVVSSTDGIRAPLLLTDVNTVLTGGSIGSFAAALDGSSQYLSNSSFSGGHTTKLSLSFWVYRTSVAVSDVMVDTDDGAGTSVLRVHSDGTTATTLTVTTTSGNYGSVVTTANLANQWYHVYVEYDGDGADNAARLKLWIDGVAQTLSFTGSMPASVTAPSRITWGAQGGGSNHIPGRLQAGAYYTAVKSAATTLYAVGRGQRYAEMDTASLVSFWMMDEASGNRADSRGSNTLTATGSPGRLAGLVNSAKTSTGGSFASANSECLSVVDHPLTSPATAFSTALWLNPSTLGVSRRLAYKGAGSNFAYSVIEDIADSSRIQASVAASPSDAFSNWVKTDTGTLVVGTWQRVVVTYDGTATPKFHIYVNGVDKKIIFQSLPSYYQRTLMRRYIFIHITIRIYDGYELTSEGFLSYARD